MYKVQNQSERKMSQLPGWLWPNSNILPPLYKKIWEAVREDKSRPSGMLGEILVDTNKIFPLLLTSQLSTEILGYIWGLANKKYAGQLTEQELYTVLALVALAQASYPFNSLEVLHLVRIPPIPNLNIALLDTYDVLSIKNEPNSHESKVFSEIEVPGSNSTFLSHSNNISNFNSLPSFNSSSVSNANSISHSNSFSSSNSNSHQKPTVRTNSFVTSTSADNLFHSAQENRTEIKNSSSSFGLGIHSSPESRETELKNNSNDSNDDFSEFQSAPLPTTTIPTIPMWDSKQGSAIGSRLANHNLGVKKPVEKLKKNGSKNSGSLGRNSTNNFGVNKDIQLMDGGSQSVNLGKNSTLHLVGNREVQLLDGGSQMNSGNSNLGYREGNFERLTEIFPKCNLKNQSKTVILKDTIIRNDSPKNTEINSKEFPVEEKIILNDSETINKPLSLNKIYSPENAQDLMNLQQTEDKYSALRVLVEEPVATFSQIEVEPIDSFTDDFGDFVSAEQPPSTSQNVESLNTETNTDLLSEFDLKCDNFLINDKNETSLVQEISDAFDALGLEEFRDQQPLESKFEIQLDSDKGFPKEDCLSVNSIELNNGPGALTRSGSVPSLDLKSFLSPSQEEESSVENMHQILYCEWKQYMESCVLLLQVAANIFSNISSEAVLREVLATAQGYNFLCNLAEVAAICRRVNFSHKEMDINIMGFDDLLMEIDRIWAEMEPFYTNIPIVTELPVWPSHPNDSETCALCLTVITSGKVSHNENNYHVTCANLWLNCVNSNLPVLRNPSTQSHSTISNSISQI